MSHEQETIESEPFSPYTKEVDEIQSLWQTLPDAHQVALVVQLANGIMERAYRPYLLYAMAQTWSLQTDELELAFPRIEISEEDLMRANLDKDEAAQLSEEDRQKISETMRSHYIHDLFWPEVKHLAQVFLQEHLENEV